MDFTKVNKYVNNNYFPFMNIDISFLFLDYSETINKINVKVK